MELEGPRGQNGLPVPWSRGGTLDRLPQLWVSRAGDGHPGVGPRGTISRLWSLVPDAGGMRGPLSHILSRPSFLAAVVFFRLIASSGNSTACHAVALIIADSPANWTTRMECGHEAECQAPWPDQSLWLADHEPLCTALLWASGSVA